MDPAFSELARPGDDLMVGPVAGVTGRSRVLATLRQDAWFWIGAGIVGTMLALAVLAPILAPHDPLFQYRDEGIAITGDPVGPNAMFPLGTDRTGRDYLSRLLFGARTSLAIAIIATGLATTIGVAVGAVAGFVPTIRLRVPGSRRRISVPLGTLLARLTDLALSFPVLLLAIALAAVMKPSVLLVILIIVVVQWAAVARIMYGRVLVLREAPFIEAARAVGIGPRRILRTQVLPHILPLAVVYGALGVASAILFEATLSFLGAGVPGPTPTWGAMLADHITWYATDPRLVLLPGLAVMLTVMGFTLVGDALRDALDPRSRGAGR